MANSKITDLTNYTTPVSADVLPIVDVSNSATKKVTMANLFNILSSLFTVKDSSDTSKKLAIDVSGVTTATTRTMTIPDADFTPLGTTLTQTATNKTLGSGTKINTSGSDATGSLYYRASDGSLTPLAPGAAGTILDISAGGLPEFIPNPAAANASTTVKGVVEEATQTEVDAKTQVGGTGAELFANPATLRATKFNDYVADTGSSTAYAIAPSPVITAYTAGQVFVWKATNANTTGTPTLNVNSLGAKTIVNMDGSAIPIGKIPAGSICITAYDGTNMQLLSATGTAVTCKAVTATYTGSTASGNQTIAHGRGVTPKFIEIQAYWQNSSGNNIGAMSTGTYDGTTTASNWLHINTAANSAGAGTSSSNIVTLYSGTASDSQIATVTMDATNVTLAWTKAGSPSSNNIAILLKTWA